MPQDGVTYHLRGSGTTAYIDFPNGRRTDVEYYDYQTAAPLDLSSPNLGSVDTGLKLVERDGAVKPGFHWGAYQSSHAYVTDFVGFDESINVSFVDVPNFYYDNTGTLTFQIYEPVKLNRMTIVNADDPEHEGVATDDAVTDFFIPSDALGSARIIIDGLIGPDRGDAKAMTLWKITTAGNTASRTGGTFNDTLANRTVTLTNGTGDAYTITAGADKNENGVLETSEIERTIVVHVQAVPTPDPISADSNSGDSITVSWINNADEPTGFIVERATGSGPFDTIVTVGADKETHTFTGLTSGGTYRFRVKALQLPLASAYSDEVSATVLTAPVAPSALTAAAHADDEEAGIGLSWTDNSSNESDFEIQRATDSAFTQNVADFTGDSIDLQAYFDTRVAAGATYYYRVRASNAAGTSAWSNTASATAPVPFPAQPYGLYALATSGGVVQLTWHDASYNETGFVVERCTDGLFGDDKVVFAALDPDAMAMRDTTATATATYYYRVIATGDAGDSKPSGEAAVQLPGYRPSQPTQVNATRISDTAMVIEWDDNSENEAGFEISRSTSPDFDSPDTQIFTVGPNRTEYEDTGLSAGVTYYHRAWAINDFMTIPGGGGGPVSVQAPITAQARTSPVIYMLRRGAAGFTAAEMNPTLDSEWFYSGSVVHLRPSTPTLRAYDPVTHRYRWDFGDAGSGYNTLDGMSAAHVYKVTQEKTFTFTLTITPPSGPAIVRTGQLRIKLDNRATRQIATQADMATLLRDYWNQPTGVQLDNMRILFKRGGTFDIGTTATVSGGSTIIRYLKLEGRKGVALGAYGSGNRPVLMGKLARGTGAGAETEQLIKLNDQSRNIDLSSFSTACSLVPRTRSQAPTPTTRRHSRHRC